MKWYWKTLIAFLTLILIGVFSIDYIVAGLVDDKVKQIQKQLEGKYNFSYSKLNVSVLNRRVSLKNFQLETIVDSLNSENKLEFSLDKLILKFNTYREVFIEGKLHISEAVLKKPKIIYGLKKELKKENVDEESFNDQPIDQIDSIDYTSEEKFINSIILDEFRVQNGEADVYHLDDSEKKLIHIKKLSLFMKDLLVDFNASTMDDMVSSKEFDLELKKISSDELKDHDLNIGEVKFNYSSKKLSILNVRFKNKEKKLAFAARQKYRTPWLDIKIDRIDIKVNPWHIYNKGIVYIKKISIDGVDAELYNDITKDLRPEHVSMPPRAIRDIPIPIKIDSILITNSELRYFHKGKAKKAGLVRLASLSTQIDNITNIDYIIDQNPMLNIKIQAKMWGKGELNSTIIFDLKNTMDYVYISGTVRNMKMRESEKMIKPLYGVEIFSGDIVLLKYDLTLNENIGKGNLRFDYKNLKVDIKKIDKEKHKDQSGNLKSSKFLNFIANEAVISTNLPNTTEYIPNGFCIYDRTKNKPIFDLFWRSMQSGIMDIVVADAFYKSEANYIKKRKKKARQEAKGKSKQDRKK